MNLPKKFKLSWLVQVLLISLFPVFHMFTNNTSEIKILHFFFAITLISFFTLILFFVTGLMYRNYFKGALLTNTLLLTFFLFQPLCISFLWPILPRLKHIGFGSIQIFRVRYILVLIVFLLLYAAYKIAKTKLTTDFLLKVLILPLSILSIVFFIKFVYANIHAKQVITTYEQNNNAKNKPIIKQLLDLKKTTKNFPNIYFILLDCYPSRDFLKKHLNFDNTPFLQELKKRGFYIASKSKSNYPSTGTSLPATLNMNYLPITRNKTPSGYMWKNNNITKYLKTLGYSYIDLSMFTDKNLTNEGFYLHKKTISFFSEIYNEFIDFLCGHENFLRLFLYSNTPLYPFCTKFFNDKKQNVIDRKLNILNKIPINAKSPFFVYAHFLIPHGPYACDENGNSLILDFTNNSSEYCCKYGMIQSIKYINKKILLAIDAILQHSKLKPIIILQADHATDDFESCKPEDRFSIFNTYYLPDGGTELLYPTISPINNFRIILNHYFKTSFPILPDKSFLPSTDEKTFKKVF